MAKNDLTIECEGTVLSEFREIEGSLPLYSCNAEVDLIIKGSSPHPVLIYSRQFSDISVKTSSKKYSISANNFLILKPKMKFKISKLTPTWQVSIIALKSNIIAEASKVYSLDQEIMSEIVSKNRTIPRKNWVNEIFHRYYFAKSVEKLMDNHATTFLELEIIKEIFYSYKTTISKEQRDIFPIDDILLSKLPTNLEKIILYVENHLFTKLTIPELANHISCEQKTLQRLFKKHLDKTPKQYITDRRLQEAHLMIRSTNYSIGEISLIIGYNSLSTFIHLFKKKFEVTPGQVVKYYR